MLSIKAFYRACIFASLIFPGMILAKPVENYEMYMKRLIDIAKSHRQPFAAMIIENDTGKILCEGVNDSARNPTLHGEIVAINNCAQKYPKLDWTKTTLITDAEPCPMCAGAIVWANISKTVYGTSIPYLKSHHWGYIDIRTKQVFEKAAGYKGTLMPDVLHEETDKVFAGGEPH